MLQRTLLPLAALSMFAVCTPQRAEATTITFEATSTGCFTATTSSTCTAASSVTSGYGLTFNGVTNGPSNPASLDSTTGGNASIALGAFSIPSDPTSQVNPTGSEDVFDLTVVFSMPNGGSNLFTADVTGKIVGNSQPNNYLWVDFSQSPLTFTFTSPVNGSFTLVVNDTAWLSYDSTIGSTSVNLTGTISMGASGGVGPSATPEPASLLLLGTGMLGTAIAARRRRSAEKKSQQR